MKNIHVIKKNSWEKLGVDAYRKSAIQRAILEYLISVNIYITSDEKINYDNEQWLLIIDDFETYVHKHKGDNLPTTYHKKIILTTDQDLIKDGVQSIDDEFLEWFVKNPECEEVYVTEHLKQIDQNNPVTRGSTALVFSHYKTRLPLESTKQETLEEAFDKWGEKRGYDKYDVLRFGAKWQAERTCNHSYILTTEQGHRVIKCSKCNDTRPI